MKYKTLFRLTLKAFGVLVILFAVPEIFYYTFMFGALAWVDPLIGWELIVGVVAPLVKLLLGVYLFFGGNWIVNLAIPSNRPYCHECGYDLRHVTTNRCPECDTPFQPADVAPPGQAKPDADR